MSLREIRGGTTYALVYLTGLFTIPVVATVAAVYFGYVTPDLTITGTIDLTEPLTWLAKGLVAVFLLYTVVQIIRITGLGFWATVAEVVTDAMDGYSKGPAEMAQSAADAIDDVSKGSAEDAQSATDAIDEATDWTDE